MPTSPEIAQCISNAIQQGCRVEFEGGGFLGQNWLEITGAGTEIIRELVLDRGEEVLGKFSAQFTPFARTQLERDGRNYRMHYEGFLRWMEDNPHGYGREMQDSSQSPRIIGKYHRLAARFVH